MNINRLGVIGGGILGLAALGYGTYWFLRYRKKINTGKVSEMHETESRR